MQEFLRAHNEAAADARAKALGHSTGDSDTDAAAQGPEPLSLWHEMQQRQQAEAAAREAELSVGPGLQGPGGMLGDNLWMFDGGLFADEGGRLQAHLSRSGRVTIACVNSPLPPNTAPIGTTATENT